VKGREERVFPRWNALTRWSQFGGRWFGPDQYDGVKSG
jgi:hypothetical protein